MSCSEVEAAAIAIRRGREIGAAVDHLPANQRTGGGVGRHQQVLPLGEVVHIDRERQRAVVQAVGAAVGGQHGRGGVLHHHLLAVHRHHAGIVLGPDRRQLVSAQLIAQHPAHELLALVAGGVVAAVDPGVDVGADLLEHYPVAQQRVGTVSPHLAVEINGGGIAVATCGTEATLGAIHGLIAEQHNAELAIRALQQPGNHH